MHRRSCGSCTSSTPRHPGSTASVSNEPLTQRSLRDWGLFESNPARAAARTTAAAMALPFGLLHPSEADGASCELVLAPLGKLRVQQTGPSLIVGRPPPRGDFMKYAKRASVAIVAGVLATPVLLTGT